MSKKNNIVIPFDVNGKVQRSRIEEGLGVEDVLGSVGTATRVRILDGKTKKVLFLAVVCICLKNHLELLQM